MDPNRRAPLDLEVEPGAEVLVPLEGPDPVPEGVGPARMMEAAFSASAYVGAMSYGIKNKEKKCSTRSSNSHVQRTKQGIPKSPQLARSL